MSPQLEAGDDSQCPKAHVEFWHSWLVFFDDALRDALVEKYGSRLATHRPEHFAVATDPARELQRTWVNEALAKLETRGAESLFRNLQIAGRFLQSYNELAVAACLQASGVQLAYERGIDGLTPDLVGLDANGRPTHIVEVLNRRRPKPVDAADKRWDELAARFGRIAKSLRIRVARISGDRTGPFPDVAIPMVQAVGSWLSSHEVEVNEGWTIGDYTYLVVAKSPGTQIELLTPLEEVWVDSDTLSEAIREKVSRYADVADELALPLIVVVGADDALAVGPDMVKSALGGQLSVSINLNIFGVGTGATKSAPLKMHATDAPRQWNTALSAIGWLKAGVDEPGAITLYPSAQAAREHGIPPSHRVVSG